MHDQRSIRIGVGMAGALALSAVLAISDLAEVVDEAVDPFFLAVPMEAALGDTPDASDDADLASPEDQFTDYVSEARARKLGPIEDVRKLPDRYLEQTAERDRASLTASRGSSSEADWQERLAAYRSRRDLVRERFSADAVARVDALEALRARHFSREEIARVRALDRLESLVP